jgi:hypothetical protein
MLKKDEIKEGIRQEVFLEYPGAFYHVMNRGLKGQTASFSDPDFKGFFGLIEDAWLFPTSSCTSILSVSIRKYHNVFSSLEIQRSLTQHLVPSK